MTTATSPVTTDRPAYLNPDLPTAAVWPTWSGA